MKIPVVVEIVIDGCSNKKAFDCFREYFDPGRKVSPAENDDEFQIWVKGWTIMKPIMKPGKKVKA